MGMGSGEHTRVQDWAADKSAGIKITASRFDAENDDFSSSLGLMIAVDGQSTVTANIPMSGKKFTGSTAASALKDVVIYQDVQQNRTNFVTVSETTAQNSISAVPQVTITSYTTGAPVYWIPGFNNTGAAKLTISGLSAASVQVAGAALTSGMLLSGVPVMAVSDGSGFHVMNPQRAPVNFVPTTGFQANSITLAKIKHETVQGALLSIEASGTPTYLAPGSAGQFLVSGGASGSNSWSNAALDNSITLAKWNHETVQGAMVYTGAAGTPAYLAPGTSGQTLTSGGASANLSWTTPLTSLAGDSSPQLGGFLDANGHYIQMQKGGDISSASPLVIDTDGDYFLVSGTTSFAEMTVAADRHFFLEFTGILTITHESGTIDIPGAANYTSVAGDVIECVSTAANVVTIVGMALVSGKAQVESVTLSNSVTLTNKTIVAANNTLTVTQGKQTIWVPVAAMRPTSSNGCDPITDVETTSGRPDMQVLDFAVSADKFAQFQVAFPKSWNEGTITFQVYWCSTATDTDPVNWTLQGVSVPDNSTIDVAYGTAIDVDDPNQGAAEEMLVSPVSSALTIAGAAVDTITFFRIGRDISEGNAAEDARLIGVKIFFTTDAENDA